MPDGGFTRTFCAQGKMELPTEGQHDEQRTNESGKHKKEQMLLGLANRFGKILFIALHQRRHILGDEVNLPANLPALARRETAQAEIRVQAASDALKQFLVRLPGCREDHLFV